jgi:hypothetical protein
MRPPNAYLFVYQTLAADYNYRSELYHDYKNKPTSLHKHPTTIFVYDGGLIVCAKHIGSMYWLFIPLSIDLTLSHRIFASSRGRVYRGPIALVPSITTPLYFKCDTVLGCLFQRCICIWRYHIKCVDRVGGVSPSVYHILWLTDSWQEEMRQGPVCHPQLELLIHTFTIVVQCFRPLSGTSRITGRCCT